MYNRKGCSIEHPLNIVNLKFTIYLASAVFSPPHALPSALAVFSPPQALPSAFAFAAVFSPSFSPSSELSSSRTIETVELSTSTRGKRANGHLVSRINDWAAGHGGPGARRRDAVLEPAPGTKRGGRRRDRRGHHAG